MSRVGMSFRVGGWLLAAIFLFGVAHAVPPQFTVQPLGDEDAFAGPVYLAVLQATGSPTPTVTVEEPAGATFSNNVLRYDADLTVGQTFNVRVVASNVDGDATAEWTVTVVDPLMVDFDDQTEFDDNFTDSGNDNSSRKAEVLTSVIDGQLELFLPGVGGESFDQWCGFDRTPRFLAIPKVFGSFAVETRVSFLTPPPVPAADYHVGLAVDRGTQDLGMFGPIRAGIEYERTCSLDGENTGTFFGGTFDIPGEDGFLRIEGVGTTHRFLARLDEADPWTLIHESTGVKPPLEGLGVTAKNWGGQGDMTTLFDYFYYEPPTPSAPTFTEAPADDRVFAGTLTYYSRAVAAGYPPPVVEILAPEGATIDSTGLISYELPSNDPDPFTVTVRATNSEGSTDASWTVDVVDAQFLDFDEQAEFDDNFFDPGFDNSSRKAEVTTLVFGGQLELTLPDSAVGENFDNWCGFDRTPRWLHQAQVGGSFAAETLVNFPVPPPTIGGQYHVGLAVDRGTQDIGILGPIRAGIEYERNCSQDGDNSGTFFTDLFLDPDAQAILRVEKDGDNMLCRARVDEADPWTTIFEVNGPRPPIVGVGVTAKNWGTQGSFTTGFDYFDYGPLPTSAPTILDAPDEGFAFKGGPTYSRPLGVDGFPAPTLEVLEPAGASIDDNLILRYDIPSPEPASFDVRVRATNFAGQDEATWTVTMVDAVFYDFDEPAEFDENFFDSENDLSTRKDEVEIGVNSGFVELVLPGVAAENFDQWCNFDRTPRWVHRYQVTDNYSAETAVGFVVPPPNIGAEYHVGLCVDRGTEDLAQFGPLRAGVEYERNCDKGGENTPTYFAGTLTEDPETFFTLRIEAEGDRQMFLARTDDDTSWVLVDDVVGSRPLPEGVGFAAKNWGNQGMLNVGFDYFEYGPPSSDPIMVTPGVAPADEDAFKELPYHAAVRGPVASSESFTYELIEGPPGALLDPDTGDIVYDPIAEPVGSTFDFEVHGVSESGRLELQAAWTVTVVNSVLVEFEDEAELEQFEFSAGDDTADRLPEVAATVDDDQLRIFLPGVGISNFDQWCGFDRAPKWMHEIHAFSTFDVETRMRFDDAFFPLTDEYHVGLAVQRGANDLSQFGPIRQDLQHERTCGMDPASAVFFADQFNLFDNPEVTLRIEKRGLQERYLARLDDGEDFQVVQELNNVKPQPIGVGIAAKNWGSQGDIAMFFEYFEYGDADAVTGGPIFRRGDVDGSGVVDISDPIANLTNQFLGGPIPCRDAADYNDSGAVDISDPIANLTNQFLGGPAAAPPGSETCGPDPTPDAGADGGDLGCENPPTNC